MPFFKIINISNLKSSELFYSKFDIKFKMWKAKFFKGYPLVAFFAYFALSHIILIPSFKDTFLKPTEDEKVLKRKIQSN